MRANPLCVGVNRTFEVFSAKMPKMRAKHCHTWVNRNFHKSDFLASKNASDFCGPKVLQNSGK